MEWRQLALVSFFLTTTSALSFAGEESVRFVDAAAVEGGNGTSWSNAYRELQDALAEALNNPAISEIRVAGGIYIPTQAGGSRGMTFELREGVNLNGGYAGQANDDPDTRDFDLYPTILSGDLNGDDNPNFEDSFADNSEHVVSCNSLSSIAIDGFTIRGGNANVYPTNDGGGMQVFYSTIQISNCNFEWNRAGGDAAYGGGLLLVESITTLNNCRFTNNKIHSQGGGISAAYGAGLANFSYSVLTATNCVFENNAVSGFLPAGGALINSSQSTFSLSDCRFIENSATGLGAIGGAIANYSTLSPSCDRCVFLKNNVDRGDFQEAWGGAIWNSNHGSPQFRNCKFLGNYATGGEGGAIRNTQSNPSFFNCIFSGNRNISIYNADNSDPTFINCSFGGNTGAVLFNTQNSNPLLLNCILWGNSFPNNQIHTDTSSGSNQSTLQFCNYESGWHGLGSENINLNPAWVDRDGIDNVTGTEDDDFHLLANSPCIDEGTNFSIDPNSLDFEGELRILDGDGNGLATIDMGVDEFLVSPCPYVISSDPPNGAIDARQPHAIDSILPALGWNFIRLNFSGPIFNILEPSDFSISSVGNFAESPEIVSVQWITFSSLLLSFDKPIPPGFWTEITHLCSGSSTRLGYLPGDANSNGFCSPIDILDLINALNGVTTNPIYSTDLNRSGAGEPSDILRLIDLLNGAGAFDLWNGASLF